MIKNTQDSQLEQRHRLEAKTQDQRMINEIVDGTQMSPWEAQVVGDVIREVFTSRIPVKLRCEAISFDTNVSEPTKALARASKNAR